MDDFHAAKIERFKNKFPDKEIPTSFCKNWSYEEEKQLLEELQNNMEEEDIAIIHQRTIGGIRSRIRLLVYKMYLKEYPMSEMITKTKLSETEIRDIIDRKQNYNKTTNNNSVITPNTQSIHVKIDMVDLQVQIDSLNKKMDKILSLLEKFDLSEY